MNKLEFIFEYSPWLILLCILTGIFYAYLLYSKKSIWSVQLNYILAGTRFILVFILSLLLLVPMIKQLENFIEQPTLAFIIDNSQSLKSSKIIEQLKNEEQKLILAGYEVEWNTLTEHNVNLDSIRFDLKTTNLSKPLKEIENNFINRNLHATILISDGIHNQGFSPQYVQTNAPVYTLGFGDTTSPKDLSIQEIFYNKIVYKGNKFPVKIRFMQSGYNSENINVTIKNKGKVVQSKSIMTGVNSIHEVSFLINSSAIGKQSYSIEIKGKEQEISTENNSRDIYIQVIDGKERILIYAAGPHPDIKTIKTALDYNQNIETVVYYDGLLKKPTGIFDLVILHQFPNQKLKISPYLKKIITKKTPVWYFIGNSSHINNFNTFQNSLFINQKSTKNDWVLGAINNDFKGFTLNNELLKNNTKLPPISVLFAEFKFSRKLEILLYQKIGSVVSTKPLMAFTEKSNGVKNAYFIGDGLWKWKIHEYSMLNSSGKENGSGIDELIQKTVRYITTKKDKRQLRVNATKEEFFTDESIKMDVEVYNDIYEKIYQKEIDITVKGEDGNSYQFSFVNDEGNSRFSLGELKKGLYLFKAKTKVNGKIIKDEGEFIVKEQYIEKITSKADFALLEKIAENTGGEFYPSPNLKILTERLSNEEHKPLIVLTDETLKELINEIWLFFLLIILVTIEWAVRKHQGDY